MVFPCFMSNICQSDIRVISVKHNKEYDFSSRSVSPFSLSFLCLFLCWILLVTITIATFHYPVSVCLGNELFQSFPFHIQIYIYSYINKYSLLMLSIWKIHFLGVFLNWIVFFFLLVFVFVFRFSTNVKKIHVNKICTVDGMKSIIQGSVTLFHPPTLSYTPNPSPFKISLGKVSWMFIIWLLIFLFFVRLDDYHHQHLLILR